MPASDQAAVGEADFIATSNGIKVPRSEHIMGDVMERRIAEGRYEGAEVECVRAVVKPGDRVIECGTGLGIVGAIAALHGQPEAMMSFEANPDLIGAIERLYSINGLEKKIELRNEVLLAGPGQPKTVSFNVRGNFLGSRLAENAQRGKLVEVPTRDFGTLRESFKPTVLIMDIEGAEQDFLEKADLDGIRAVIMEFHPKVYGIDGMRQCKSILRKAGFGPVDGSTRVVWGAVRDL